MKKLKEYVETAKIYALVSVGILLLGLVWLCDGMPDETHEHNHYE